MKTVLAGRGRRISVPFPASSWIGRPLGGISVAAAGSAAAGRAASEPAAADFGAVSGVTSCAELLAPIIIKLDPAMARTSNLCITTPWVQVAMQQHRSLFHLHARS